MMLFNFYDERSIYKEEIISHEAATLITGLFITKNRLSIESRVDVLQLHIVRRSRSVEVNIGGKGRDAKQLLSER